MRFCFRRDTLWDTPLYAERSRNKLAMLLSELVTAVMRLLSEREEASRGALMRTSRKNLRK